MSTASAPTPRLERSAHRVPGLRTRGVPPGRTRHL